MSIKNSLGKLKLPLPFTKLVAEQVYGNAIELLHVSPQIAEADGVSRRSLAQSLAR
jgi:PIN domain nuclease of toxin-antitoxin system